MILVIGGTGRTGSALLEGLARHAVPVRALVRAATGRTRPVVPGVQYVTGDAGDSDALTRAFADVTQLFLVTSNGVEQERIETGVVAAAARAGVGHVVKVSAPVVGPDVAVDIARMHGRVEAAITGHGMTGTFLRPYAFMQNLLNTAATIRSMGLFFGITGDAPVNIVDARDIADVALAVLLNPEHRGGSLQLTGPQSFSYPEVAELLTGQVGRRIRYVDQSVEEFRRGLRRAGLPEWLQDHLVEIQQLTLDQPESPTDTVARVTGHAPRTLVAFVAEQRASFVPPWWAARTPVGGVLARSMSREQRRSHDGIRRQPPTDHSPAIIALADRGSWIGTGGDAPTSRGPENRRRGH